MFHKEGFKIIALTSLPVVISIILADTFIIDAGFKMGVQLVVLLCFLYLLQFFRNPRRSTPVNEQHIIAPADGKIIAIQETLESEYFNDQRLQISIVASPFDAHVTRYPASGRIHYNKHHQEQQKEYSTVVIATTAFGEVLYQQIGNTTLKRVINYAEKNNTVVQGEDAGFIKFGSKVDLFLPLGTTLNVQLGDRIKGGEQIIASKEL